MNNSTSCKIKKISENLKKLVSHHKISFRHMSKSIGVAQPHLVRLTQEKHASPGIGILDKISKFFGISIAQLIGDQHIDLCDLPDPIYPNKEELSALKPNKEQSALTTEEPSQIDDDQDQDQDSDENKPSVFVPA